MSGGVAYLLDAVPTSVNAELVDLEALGEDDQDVVADLLRRHEQQTGSTVAAGLLGEPGALRRRVSKLMPRDYARVLAARAAAERDGRDVLDCDHGGLPWLTRRAS